MFLKVEKDLQISTQVVFNSTEFTVLIAWAAPWQHKVALPYSVCVCVSDSGT